MSYKLIKNKPGKKVKKKLSRETKLRKNFKSCRENKHKNREMKSGRVDGELHL
jgi:hypothetical protein